MIDSHELADALLQEAQLLGESITINNEVDMPKEEKFARAVEQFPLPDRTTIASVVGEVFWSSMLTEESRPCRPRLLYFPGPEAVHSATHRLKIPIPLNRDSLRKLTPAQGPLGYLTWDRTPDGPKIVGIQGRQGGDACDFVIGSGGYGAIDMSWHCMRLVALRAGRLDRLSRASLPTMSNALNVVWQLLGSFDPVYLHHVISAIARDGHGGSVWMLREGQIPDGIQVGHPTYQDEPPPREKHEQRFKWLNSIGHLAAIDGAVLLDAELRLLGFGAFIEVPRSVRTVTCISLRGNPEPRPSTDLGGGRHRSAVEFCSRFAPAAAIVVSEDGRISLLWAAAHSEIFWVRMSILGFSGDIIASGT